MIIRLIFTTIKSRLKYLISKQNTNKNKIDNNSNCNKKLIVGFRLNLQFLIKFKNTTKDLNVNLSYFSLNKLGYIIKEHKDILPNLSQKNVIYKLSCRDCDLCRTCRKLKTRINEHRNHIATLPLSR